MEVSLKNKNKKQVLTYDPANPLPAMYPEKTKTLIQKIQAPRCSQQHYLQDMEAT